MAVFGGRFRLTLTFPWDEFMEGNEIQFDSYEVRVT